MKYFLEEGMMKFDRQQYIDLMTFRDSIRPMFVELFGPIVGLEKEWRAQGATDAECNLTAFNFDHAPHMPCGGNCGLSGGMEPRIIEETDTYLIKTDALGRTMKLDKSTATIPLPMSFPVSDMDSWLAVKHLYECNDSRICRDTVERAVKAQREGALILAEIPGVYNTCRELMGEEMACTCHYLFPQLLGDIVDTLHATSRKVLEQISAALVIDNLFVHEDMAGRSGPMVGPDYYDTYAVPYYRDIYDLLHARGTKLFSLDSDGNVTPLIDSYLRCGVNILYPCEPAAGMDMVNLRKQYGNRLAFKGGINKFALQKGPEAIRAELEYKLQECMRTGTVFGIDHRIPNGVSIENYRYYVATAKEMLDIAPDERDEIGWMRMAF
jgi:uroporphyrinogen-III decarboxylase